MANEKSVMAVIRAARPSFKNKHDKIAFVVHASFLASGYMLTATGPPAFADSALSSASTDEVGIDNWNQMNNKYAFVYTNPEKNWKKVLVKCLAMNGKLAVDALADGDSEPARLEIHVDDYVGKNGGANYSAQFKKLDKLVKSLVSKILSKLDLKFGSSEAASSSSNAPPSSSQTSEGSRRDINKPGIGELVGPQIHPSGNKYPPVNTSGGSDLFPGPGAGMYPKRADFGSGSMLLGPKDCRWYGRIGEEPGFPREQPNIYPPVNPSGGTDLFPGPGAGMYPKRADCGSRSMLLGPNDPRWFGGIGGEPGFPGGQPGVPPGARFDPYGPPGVPGFEPNRFARNPPSLLEHFGSGTHPDLEHFEGWDSSRPGALWEGRLF